MARPKKKPEYRPENIMNELLDVIVEEYEKSARLSPGKVEIKAISDELEITPHKARKLLITAGLRDGKEYYSNATGNRVLSLYQEGKTVNEIMSILSINRTSVCCYLPYTKGLYNAKELSVDAERIRKYRDRQERCREFASKIRMMKSAAAEEYLWDTLIFLEGCVFHTSGRGIRGGLRFKYKIRGGEMFIDRKEKSITRSTVKLAFNNTMKLQESIGCVSGPKAIGTFGASYLYPIFLRLGICRKERNSDAENRT